ncbi:MAG: hypothetical protein L3J07_03370 [Candidatus Magasanikbacteria bacterium]|nr:hypothetical protein [Candidatus Magasanikbacteria bacterium]
MKNETGFTKQQKGEDMFNFEFVDGVFEVAKKTALVLKETGEKKGVFQFGQKGGKMFISTERALLVSPKEIEVEKNTFYISFFER